MKVKKVKKLALADKLFNRCLLADLSPPEQTAVKELIYASMSGIIPGRLHLCRACFRFIPASQI